MFRQLVHISPDGIAMVDLQGNILNISPKAKQLFSYLLDHNTEGLCIFNFIEPSYLNIAITNVSNILENKIFYSDTNLMLRIGGSTFSVEDNSKPIQDYLGNTKGILSIIKDIT